MAKGLVTVTNVSRWGLIMRKFAALTVILTAGLFIAACESPEERAAGYLTSAQQLYDEGDLVKAEIELRNTLQIQPKNPDARYLLSQIAESRGDFQEMAQNLRIAIESRPEFTEARVKLATLYVLGGATDLAEEQATVMTEQGVTAADLNILNARISAANGDLETARAELETALDKEPDNVQALGLLASVAANTDMDRALQLVDQGISVAEDDKPLRLLRIQLLERAGRGSEVDAEYQQLLADYPDDVGLGYQYARYLAENDRIDEVEPVLREIIAADPENIQARMTLTQFVANTRGPEAAEETLREFVDAAPDAHELRMSLASLYQATDRPDDAYTEFEYVAKAVPNEDEGLNSKARMAGILIARGDAEEGEAMLEEVLAIDTMNTDALLLRGALRVDQRKYRDAVSDFRNLLRKNPDDKRAQSLLANAHAAAGDTVLAKDAYRRVLEIDRSDAEAPVQLARLLAEEGDEKAAMEVMERRTKVAPADVRAARIYIALLVNDGDFRDARREAERVAALPEQEPVGNYLLGGVYAADGKDKEAAEYFAKSLAAVPSAREPLQGLVGSLIRLDRTDEAVQYLEDLTVKYPDNLFAKTLLGQVLAGSGDAVAAEQVLEATLESNEGWLPGYTALAGMQGGDINAQIDIYKRGLDAMPGNQEMALLLGTAYERSGQVDDAIAAYEEILTVNPDAVAVANNLAALLADYRKDEASLQRALELSAQFENSDNPAFLDTLGWVYYRLGEYEKAVPLLKKSVDAAPRVPVLRYHLGMAYIATGKPTLGKRELEQALENEDVDFTGIEDARAALSEL